MSVHADDAPWRKLYKRVVDADRYRVRVGVLASKGGLRKHKASDLTLVEIAAIHEFGSPAANIPERSFIRRTFLHRVYHALVRKITDICKAIVLGVVDTKQGVGLLGAWGAAEVKNTITQDDIPPPLTLETVKRKGSSKPLVDTGQLKNSISWEVVDEHGGVK